MIRQIVVDFAVLEDSKIIQDDNKFLVVKAVIASEIVHKYKDGMAYKLADELEKAAWTADCRWVKLLAHPKSSSLDCVEDVNGKMMNPVFRKDLGRVVSMGRKIRVCIILEPTHPTLNS